MRNVITLDVATRITNFEPPHVPNGFCGACNRVANRFLDAVCRRAGQLYCLVNVVTHLPSPLGSSRSRSAILARHTDLSTLHNVCEAASRFGGIHVEISNVLWRGPDRYHD